jgi:lipopolysaccharide export system protein LptA
LERPTVQDLKLSSRVLAGLLSLAMVSSTSPIRAQTTSAPLELVADQADVIRSQCRSVWKGRAEATQGATRLRAQSIVAIATKSGADSCGATTRLEADGDVYFVSPEQTVHGAHAVFLPGSGQLDVSGDVIVVQGRNVAKGEHLVVNTRTGTIELQSGGTGRVKGVFYSDASGTGN